VLITKQKGEKKRLEWGNSLQKREGPACGKDLTCLRNKEEKRLSEGIKREFD